MEDSRLKEVNKVVNDYWQLLKKYSDIGYSDVDRWTELSNELCARDDMYDSKDIALRKLDVKLGVAISTFLHDEVVNAENKKKKADASMGFNPYQE